MTQNSTWFKKENTHTNLHGYIKEKVFQGFRLNLGKKKQDDYFQVTFDHFGSELHCLRQLGQKTGSSVTSNCQIKLKLAEIPETQCLTKNSPWFKKKHMHTKTESKQQEHYYVEGKF